jgi:hypothetical protein
MTPPTLYFLTLSEERRDIKVAIGTKRGVIERIESNSMLPAIQGI